MELRNGGPVGASGGGVGEPVQDGVGAVTCGAESVLTYRDPLAGRVAVEADLHHELAALGGTAG